MAHGTKTAISWTMQCIQSHLLFRSATVCHISTTACITTAKEDTLQNFVHISERQKQYKYLYTAPVMPYLAAGCAKPLWARKSLSCRALSACSLACLSALNISTLLVLAALLSLSECLSFLLLLSLLCLPCLCFLMAASVSSRSVPAVRAMCCPMSETC